MQIKLKDGKTLELPENSTARDLAEKLNLRGPEQALAASVNGRTLDLATPLHDGDQVTLWNFDDPEGKEVFWHTSAHVLAQAVLRLWPDAKPTIGPPIDHGFYYDFANLSISDADFAAINQEMEKIVSEGYQSQRQRFSSKQEAISTFSANKYKCELITGFPDTEELTAYRQGEFFDLCRGPHLPNVGKIKAIQVMKISGAYWRGDAKNEMLTRIYATSFPSKKLLRSYLDQLEEAKKRDHKILGPKLDLFSLKEEAPGLPFIHPAGMIIWNQLIRYCQETFRENGYVEIKTPVMLTRELWERSGHWQNYRENMFTAQVEDRDFAIKPMNCPGGMLFFRTHVHSYRELPMRVAEIGHVHRNEASGALSGLFRARGFHQDDAHIFMRPSDIENEILGAVRLADQIYSTFGLQYTLKLGTRPKEHTIGSDEDWNMATQGLKGALDRWGAPYRLNEGDGAFYGPKIDFHIRDALDRTWQCGTIQLDMALPQRFELEYTAEDGSRQRPIMIHRALLGSLERFFGILIEHFAGKFPLWISPRQVRLLTVAERHLPYAQEVHRAIYAQGFHSVVDGSNESVGKKVRNAQLDQVNYILAIGDQEVEHRTIAVRTRDNVVHGEMSLAKFLEALELERSSRSLTSVLSANK